MRLALYDQRRLRIDIMKSKRNSTNYTPAVLGRKPGFMGRRESDETMSQGPHLHPVRCRSGEGPFASQLAFMRLILREIAAGVVISDTGGTIMLANRAAREIAQLEPEGRSLDESLAIWGQMFDAEGREIPVEEQPCLTALRGEPTKRKDCRLIQSNGADYNVLWSATPVIVASGQAAGVLATLTDVTAVKRQESKRREQAVTRERARMAADLHDTLCQGLTATVFQLEAAEEAIRHNSKAALRHLQCAREAARSNLSQARRSLWTFSNERYGSDDPARVLAVIARQIMRGTPIALSLSLQPQRQALPPAIASELVRIGQEALTNVVKHSQAKRVHVQLLYKKHVLELRVADDGRGIAAVERPATQRGFGLTGMHARAERLGGTIVVESQPGHGTRLVASLPLPPNA